MSDPANVEVPTIEEIEVQFEHAAEAGKYRLALLWRFLLMRERALKTMKDALALPENGNEAKAESAQRSTMLLAADEVMRISDQLDVRQWAFTMTDDEAHSVLLVLDLGTADAFQSSTHMFASRGGRASAIARGDKRDKVRAAYAELMKAQPALKAKEAAFELHKQFPERSVLGLEATIRRWREAN